MAAASLTAACVALSAGPAVAAQAAARAPLVLTNVFILNFVNPGDVQYHGLGNLITLGSNPSHMYQADCHDINWIGGGTVPACEWGNASGLCFGASQSDAQVRAEVCTGATTQLWWTARVPGGTANQYYLLNSHWTGVSGTDEYAAPTTSSLGADITALGILEGTAIWLIG